MSAMNIKSLNTPATRARLTALGAEPVGNLPEDFRKLLVGEQKLWTKVVKESGAKVD